MHGSVPSKSWQLHHCSVCVWDFMADASVMQYHCSMCLEWQLTSKWQQACNVAAPCDAMMP